MAIIIKDMEMPTNCDCCHFLHRIEQDDDHPAFYICQIESIGKPITHIPMSSIDIDKRQDWCPLEPVVHGHWIYADGVHVYGVNSDIQLGSYRCSACGNCSPHVTNYCGLCGADMRR